MRTGPHAARHALTLRSVVFRFEDITAFSVALGDARGSLALPEGETVSDGEWVLAIFEIGSRRRATAAAARGVRAAGDTHIAYERRDWERLLQFVAARSEHMRAARPVQDRQDRQDRQGGEHGATSSGRAPAASEIAPTERRLDQTGEHEVDPPPSSMLESSRVPFGARILLVDDDAGTREEVRKMLVEIGLVVEAVGTASDAHTKMTELAFDALVLDFHGSNAQSIDPLDFVRTLRRDPLSRPATQIPVLILSHRPSSRDVVDAFASGADDFLPKPFRAPELGARIFGLLRRARLTRGGSSFPGTSSGPRSSGGGGGVP